MEKQTYSAGKYSMIKLPDKSKFLIEVLDYGFIVRKIKFFTLPSKVIWNFNALSRIRTPLTTSEVGVKGLDYLLESIKTCTNEENLKEILDKKRKDFFEYLKTI